MNLEVFTTGGCPIVVATAYPTQQCEDWVKGMVSALSHPIPGVAAVVLSNSPSYPFGAPRNFQVGEALGTPAGRSAAISGWATGVDSVVNSIPSSVGVVVVDPIFQLNSATFPTCLMPTVFSYLDVACAAPAESALSDRNDLDRAVRDQVGTRATYLDLSTRLCAGSSGCSAYQDGLLMYRDGAHLSVAGSLRYVDDAEVALESAKAHAS
jgi:hypothetical protein